MRTWIFALGLAGCGFSASPAGPGSIDGTVADAAIPVDSAPLDGKAMALCGGTLARVCVDPPSGPVALAAAINTSGGPPCAPYTSPTSTDACVIAGTAISLAAGTVTVTVTGTKPLILFATSGAITIDGTLDAASHRGGTTGPAAGAAVCRGARNPGTAALGGVLAGGGWGASLGAKGADGGDGYKANGFFDFHGTAPDLPTTTKLAGGCDAGDGGDAISNGGGRGRGGGAIELVALGSITITGTINASGAGGSGGKNGSGGGGGGAGGIIVLDAPAIAINGKCFANGGGGGEGASGASGGDGSDPAAPDGKASGGKGKSDGGGDGGDGGFGSTSPTAGKNGTQQDPGHGGDGAAGGGGGAIGIIKVYPTGSATGTIDPAHVSPPPS
jgi:hypothetical protein